jgi:hypothetical protein
MQQRETQANNAPVSTILPGCWSYPQVASGREIIYGSVSVSLRRFWVDCRQDRSGGPGDSLRIWPLRRAFHLTCPRVAGPAWPTVLT